MSVKKNGSYTFISDHSFWILDDTEAEDRVGIAYKMGWREGTYKENLTKYTIFENATMIPSTL